MGVKLVLEKLGYQIYGPTQDPGESENLTVQTYTKRKISTY